MVGLKVIQNYPIVNPLKSSIFKQNLTANKLQQVSSTSKCYVSLVTSLPSTGKVESEKAKTMKTYYLSFP